MQGANVFAPGEAVGYQIPNKPRDYFSYPATVLALAQTNGVATATFQIDAGSDFFWTASTFFADATPSLTATLTVATIQVPRVLVQVIDNGSSRNLFFAPLPISLVAGDGNHPHRLIHPRLFKRNSSISVTFTSFDTSATFSRVTFNFEGFRIYQ